METNLINFMNNTEILGKDFSMYKDEEKGIIFPLNTVHLLARVDYLELDKNEYTIAVFQKKIEDLEYNETTIKRPVPKNEITKDDKDKYTIVEKELKAKQVWNVSNSAGAYKSFSSKKEATSLANDINAKVLEHLK